MSAPEVRSSPPRKTKVALEGRQCRAVNTQRGERREPVQVEAKAWKREAVKEAEKLDARSPPTMRGVREDGLRTTGQRSEAEVTRRRRTRERRDRRWLGGWWRIVPEAGNKATEGARSGIVNVKGRMSLSRVTETFLACVCWWLQALFGEGLSEWGRCMSQWVNREGR